MEADGRATGSIGGLKATLYNGGSNDGDAPFATSAESHKGKRLKSPKGRKRRSRIKPKVVSIADALELFADDAILKRGLESTERQHWNGVSIRLVQVQLHSPLLSKAEYT